MRPSVKKRWIVVGTAAALGMGVAGAAAVGTSDQDDPSGGVDAVTLDGPEEGATDDSSVDESSGSTGPASTDVSDPSPESSDSPPTAVDTSDSPDDPSTQSARSAETASPSPQHVQSADSADSDD
ncbi:hypothetical protein [Isoptericola sp. b408]|uniref:hypothetical protein n=1 Tax=Isoptericola sp. b408 TaxID=3064653 RepID=UPI002712A38E|nr:hypothetical protein [Isoptericola sp. b408]MDO8152063.1 hypothetical protein [Isoptericola sp. b408]